MYRTLDSGAPGGLTRRKFAGAFSMLAASTVGGRVGPQTGDTFKVLNLLDYGADPGKNNRFGTDSAQAFQACFRDAGQDFCIVLIPPGAYYTSESIDLFGFSGVIVGAGATVYTDNRENSTIVTSQWKKYDRHYATKLSYVRFRDPFYPIGTTKVYFENEDAIKGFEPGDFIYLRCRSLLNPTSPTYDGDYVAQAELNIVERHEGNAVDLRYPLSKPLADDQDIYGRRAEYGAAVGNSVTSKDIAIVGLTVVNDWTRPFELVQVHNCVLDNCTAVGPGGFGLRGRMIWLDSCQGDIRPRWESSSPRPWHIALDTCTSDVWITRHYSASRGAGNVHIHEAVANLSLQGTFVNGQTDSAASERWPALTLKAGSFNVSLDVTIVNSPLGNAIEISPSSMYPSLGHRALNVKARICGQINGRSLFCNDFLNRVDDSLVDDSLAVVKQPRFGARPLSVTRSVPFQAQILTDKLTNVARNYRLPNHSSTTVPGPFLRLEFDVSLEARCLEIRIFVPREIVEDVGIWRHNRLNCNTESGSRIAIPTLDFVFDEADPGEEYRVGKVSLWPIPAGTLSIDGEFSVSGSAAGVKKLAEEMHVLVFAYR